MKNITLLIILFLPLWVSAQSFVEKSNAIQLDFTKEVKHTTLPEIIWETPRIESSFSTEKSIMLEARIKSSVELSSVKLVLNVKGQTVEKEISIGALQNSFNFEQKLNLLDGSNVVELVAVNKDGGTVSSKRSILHGTDDITSTVDANRKDYALIIATDEYENWGDLNNPIHDANTIETILKEKYGFETEKIINPTVEEINDVIYEYNTKRFNPQDQLLIFVAGHGYFDDTLEEGYVVATNSLKNDKGRTTYLSHNLLRVRIDNIKCEHIMLVMDVCFGGTFDPSMTRRRGEAVEKEDADYLVKKLTKRTRKFLTSGSKEYVPDGRPGMHSPFAEKFILALREVGGGEGRILSTSELVPYFLRLPTEPRFGSFGSDEANSDFVFVAKH
ncbi:MAG: caspase family protein [Cyclobacteriaceae bacterium]